MGKECKHPYHKSKDRTMHACVVCVPNESWGGGGGGKVIHLPPKLP